MSLPILQPSTNPNVPQIRGDVTIDESVIFASDVILNATAGYKITIHAGVCLGMGTIITAHEGDVEIHANAILGPGVLILGNCVIGSQASLGTSVTIFHGTIESLAVISAGTIIGDSSRQVAIDDETNKSEQTTNSVAYNNSIHQTATVSETSANINFTSVTTQVSQTVSESNQDNSSGVSTPTPDQDSQQSIIDKINQLNQNKHLGNKNQDNKEEENNINNGEKPPITSESIKENIGSKPGLNSYVNNHNLPNENSGDVAPEEVAKEEINEIPQGNIGNTNNTIDRQEVEEQVEPEPEQVEEKPKEKKRPKITSEDILPKSIKPPSHKPQVAPKSPQIPSIDNNGSNNSSSNSNNGDGKSSESSQIVEKKEVVGKVYINRLLYTLFPEKNRLS